MTDQTIAELNVSGDHDPDVAKRTVGTLGGEDHVHLASSLRTAERSSGLSDSDDPPGGSEREEPEEIAMTKAGAHLIQSGHLPRNAGANNVKFQLITVFGFYRRANINAAAWTADPAL